MNKSRKQQLLCSYGEPAPIVSRGLDSLKKRPIDVPPPPSTDRLLIPDTDSPPKFQKLDNPCAPPAIDSVVQPHNTKLTKKEEMKKNMSSSINMRKQRPTRPSLSQQLATIGQQASGITAEIKKRAGITESMADLAIYSCPARSFSVGNLQARVCTSLVYFYRDHAQYVFHHPYQTATEISMRMYYRDMQTYRLANNKFSFHIASNLHQCFTTSDYNPGNPSHMIVVEFASSLSVDEVKKRVLPLIPGGRR